MIHEQVYTRAGAYARAQELADRHNTPIYVLERFRRTLGVSQYLLSSARRQSGWAFSGVVISRAMLGVPVEEQHTAQDNTEEDASCKSS